MPVTMTRRSNHGTRSRTPITPTTERLYLSFPDDYDELSPEQQHEVCEAMATAIQTALGKGRGNRSPDPS